MRTKRDRFEAMVRRAYETKPSGCPCSECRLPFIVRLLRRQHNAIVRAVKKFDGEEFANMSDDFQAGQHNAYARVLATLARMKGGR